MKRHSFEEATARQLDLLAPPPAKPRIVRTPQIETPAPSVPKQSSEDAADAITKSIRRPTQWRRVLIALYKLPIGAVLSREELSERTEIKESTMCARLAELKPMWVEEVESAVIARSKLKVTGYRLTDAGRSLFSEKPLEYSAHELAILKEWGER